MYSKTEVIILLDIVFDTLGGDYTFDAFEIIKEGGKVTTIAGPPDEETVKQIGMTDYKLPEKLSKLIEEKSVFINIPGCSLIQSNPMISKRWLKMDL